ncbi:MAG: IS21-like element helper ATPase IstB [Bacteroidales bacterium]|jgi:DNA replication protein DnaC|nr:IS21-like element helper ATPase IstB [Bacteroidales bacterium]
MKKSDQIKNYCRQLKLSAIANNFDTIVTNAENDKISYLEFAVNIFETQINQRMEMDKERRSRQAKLPLSCNLNSYDYSSNNGIEKQQMNQLRELAWMEQNFNLILMGPSGTGKTYIAAGLCFDAIEKGYRAYFKTMEELVQILKMKDITRTASTEYKRILKSHLLVIDDIMMFPIEKQDAITFFNLINELHNKTSLIITTNKSPKQWADILKDEVLTTALLDRILHRCEVIKLTGNSYRMKNRKTIFNDSKK